MTAVEDVTPMVNNSTTANSSPIMDLSVQQLKIIKIEQIRALMMRPTSRNDIQYMLDNKGKVIEYKDLDKFNNIEELLEPYMSVVILDPNPSDPETGHWTCLFTNSGTNHLQFFNSYGSYIDEDIKEYNNDVFHRSEQFNPTLLTLILNSRYADNMHYNDTPYQSTDVATNCCGLWVVARLKNKHLNEYAFEKIYYDLPIERGIDPDLLVSCVVGNLYPEMLVTS